MSETLPEVRSYLDDVRSHLHLDPVTERRIVRELYTYFQERVEELRQTGLSESDATKAAIRSFGRARVVAQRMYEAHSKGSWREAAIATSPHLIIASLFALHLWRHPILAPTAFALIVCVTLYGWWHGKPNWLYPWIGYSLLPLLIGAYASAPTLGQAASFLLWGRGSFPSGWLLLLIFMLFSFSIWIIVSTTIGVVRRDWILASLMLVPLPVVGGWLVSLGQAGGLFQGNVEVLQQSDMRMMLALIALGVTSAAFIRFRQRVLKVGALVTVGTIALVMIGHNLWGDWGFLGPLLAALVLLVFVLSPALVEAKVGHGEEKGEVLWRNGWLEQPSGKG